MVKGYSLPPTVDYSNNWSALDADKWTGSFSTGSGASSVGTITTGQGTIALYANNSDPGHPGYCYLQSLTDIRSLFKMSVAVSMASEGYTYYQHGATYPWGYMRLTDGGGNTYTIVKLGPQVQGTEYNNRDGYPCCSASTFGTFQFINENGKIRVRHNAQHMFRAGTMGAQNATDTSTIVADNTLIDTSGWSAVYLYFSCEPAYYQANVYIQVLGFQISPFYIGSKGTQ